MRLRCRIWLLISQSINSLALHGDPDESLSARAWREGWHAKIDRWLGEGHCGRVWQDQLAREDARRTAPRL